MTKVGEGNLSPEERGVESYKQELDVSSRKFLKALEEYDRAPRGEKQKQFRSIMDQQMEIIKSSISELNKKGIHKEAMKVTKDYKDYLDEKSSANYTCLHNDIETLRELNQKNT